MKKFNNILLFGGSTKNENMPSGFYSSLAMYPLRGKPVIYWQLSNLKQIGIDNFIIVVSKDNLKLIKYVKNILSANYDIKLVLLNSKKTILSSLKYALKECEQKLPTRVILGDTMLTKSINSDLDIIYTSKDFSVSANWCLISKDKNNIIDKFYDKKKDISIADKEVVVGYYAFSDTKQISTCCNKARLMLKKEISDALDMYKEFHPLKSKLVKDWHDLGHTSGIIKVKNALFNARSFNSISVDTELGILIKSSTKIQKLEDEAFWLKNLPEDLKVSTPRFIEFIKNIEFAQLKQELYGYPSLQELYLSGEVNIEDWSYILEKLFNLHKYFEKHSIPSDKKALHWLYVEKTQERINELFAQDDYWKNLFNKDYEIINGCRFKGFNLLKKDIDNFAKIISENAAMSIMHGDYCFSNILFDSNNYIFKLIDPRGRLNSEATIYGDARYDIAKLRHSVCGLYDFIVQGLFKVIEKNNGFNYTILLTQDYSILNNLFDKLAVKNGFDVKEIKFIEGLLFLTMIPLHKDDFNRQKMFYLKAIELLNETLFKTDEEIINGKEKVAYMY